MARNISWKSGFEILVSWLVTKTIQYSGQTREYNNIITKQGKEKRSHVSKAAQLLLVNKFEK